VAVGRAGRVVLALGGNAIAPAGRPATAEEQTANITRAMERVADLVAEGLEVVLTHGNGPQVGNLLVKNELARDVVPPVPLDWCVAQTQATIGYVTVTALARALRARGAHRPIVPVISRVLVAADDPAWSAPSKPIGMWIADEAEARRKAEATGQHWVHLGERGWRRVVPSPEPLASLEGETVRLLLAAGAVVVANGGGGIPMIHDGDGMLHGVEAVVDKDLSGALLAREVGATRFVILTDVPGVAIGYDGPSPDWLGSVDAAKLRRLLANGEFAAGSMGPKVEAVLRFVESTARPAAIAALDDLLPAVKGEAGTQVLA
jgi:carbamate kinase